MNQAHQGLTKGIPIWIVLWQDGKSLLPQGRAFFDERQAERHAARCGGVVRPDRLRR